jgi:Xaa-Pro aminopeptidase
MNEFANRRKDFLSKIKNTVALFISAPQVYRNHDVSYDYRQDSNFYYLTAFPEPQSIALFCPNSKNPFSLFVQPKDEKKELWDGKLFGPEGAKKTFGADFAAPITPLETFEEAFIQALCQSEKLYYKVGFSREWDEKVFELMNKAIKRLGRTGRSLWPILDPNEITGEMRVFKTKYEIEKQSRACQISAEAHCLAIQKAAAGQYEYQVQSLIEQDFKAKGAARVGYGSIVASGDNACTLHYIENTKMLKEGELLLIDAGAEYEYYSGDITRTFPVSKKFSKEQKEIYSAVLKVQKECIKMVKPGLRYKEIHNCAVEGLSEELRKLKILTGTTKSIIEKKEYFKYFPHGTGHWLGMDVHDAGYYFDKSYDTPRKIEANMVFTIEPGLYFGKGSPAKYQGIGVRIEDNILVTNNGCKVLTSHVPKEVEEIEALRSSK